MSPAGRRHPAGRRIFRVWLAASALYVAVIGLISIAPIRTAIETAKQAPAPTAPPAAPIHTTGPIADAPASPGMKAAEVAGRQALIAAAPPLLLLWFGWDLWFAVSGLLPLRRSAPKTEEASSSFPSPRRRPPTRR
jgi:hypothetical protein